MSKKSNVDVLMDLTMLARDKAALGQIRAGIVTMAEAYGESYELQDLADAFDACEQSREVDTGESEAIRLAGEAEDAFRAAHGRETQAHHESGAVWALRSLNIPDHSAAIIAYARRNDDGTWDVFPLPPKTKWGTWV